MRVLHGTCNSRYQFRSFVGANHEYSHDETLSRVCVASFGLGAERIGSYGILS